MRLWLLLPKVIANVSESTNTDDKLIEGASTNPPNVYGFGHEGYYRNVLRALQGGLAPDTDGREGRKSLELILAIYESARTHSEVRIPAR